MSYFEEIYMKRANRFGKDYQSRIQGEREHLFELYLEKTLYRVLFYIDTRPDIILEVSEDKAHQAADRLNTILGSFEKKSQDNTETTHYLLTKVDCNIPAGTILQIPDKDGIYRPWLVYYLENIKASGYNRYIMLKMSHIIEWTDREGIKRHTYGYMYGQEDNMLKDELRSRSRMDTLYTEALKMSFIVIPANSHIRKDDYILVQRNVIYGQDNQDPAISPIMTEPYRVTGYDIQSAEGVEYVTVDPIYRYDESEPSVYNSEEDSGDVDWYWLTKGESTNGRS